tara:strand:+ start:50568 stop:52058 length:1491 start_codon:yes stop_codon:yes gene_type:complete
MEAYFMSKFDTKNLSSATVSLKKIEARHTILHIVTDDDMKRTDLALPLKGRRRISSELGKISYIDTPDKTHVIFGAGSFNPKKHLTPEQWEVAVGAHLFDALKAEKIREANLQKNTFLSYRVGYGFGVRSFNNGYHGTSNTIRLGGVNTDFENGFILSKSTNFTRLLTNTPHGNYKKSGLNTGLNAQSFVELLREEFPDNITHSGNIALSRINARGIMSVGRASEHEPALFEATYCHEKCTDDPIVFVAKGVMYDTGGAAIKPGDSMATMKYDMTAASTAAGILKALKDSHANCHVKVVFCLADNAVGPKMTLNGDRVEMMDGKVVEITNTDAEGRVVLYDGLVYAQKHISNAKAYISMGTLTGTGRQVMGERAAMYFCENEKFNKLLRETSQACGKVDELFRLPIDLRLEDCVQSPEPGVDLKNYTSGTGCNGSELAYYFLRAAMKKENKSKHIHFDIANVGGGHKDITGLKLPYFTGTGWGVLTLTKLFKQKFS